MRGLPNRTALGQAEGCFVTGAIDTGALRIEGGGRLVMFLLKFPLKDEDMDVLKSKGNGIHYLVDVLRHPSHPRMFYVHFASGPDENQVYSLALQFREKVIAHYRHKSVTPTPPVVPSKTRTTPKDTTQQPPPAQPTFSDYPLSSRK